MASRAMPFTEARFTVLMFTDIVDSTGLKATHGVTAYMAAFERHNALFESIARGFSGMQILQHTGDGYFATFSGVADAVRFALLFQHAMRREKWTDFALETRVGIHAGEVAATEILGKTNLLGPAPDLTSRVMSLGRGGQILLTRGPFDEARPFVREHPPIEDETAPALSWLAHGPYRMKGRDEPMEIFEVGAQRLAPLLAPPDSEKAKRAIRPGEEETLGWRPAIGLEIPGRPGWHLTEKLGAGGFGEVWVGEHAKLHQCRAFKFCFDEERLRALKREVTLVRLLRSALGERDDIVHIHELKLDAPPFYLESDLAPHGNLLQWAKRQGGLDKIPLPQRIALVAHTATALAAAHSIGVLHKDIKPTNILIFDGPSGEPRPRLVDFGIGTLADPAVLGEFGVTSAGFTRLTIQHSTGTPTYSPPEYLAGKPYTVQGDIYGLGVMLYQLVTADTERPLAPGWERDVPDRLLREDIAACVDGDPSRRLPSTADLATRLRSLDARRAEAEARLTDESNRLGFAVSGAILMLVFILGGVALTLRKSIALPDGNIAEFIVINTFSLPDLMVAFTCIPVFLSVCYRYFRSSRRNTDLILALLLLQILAWCMVVLTLDNTVPEGIAAKKVAGAKEVTLLLCRLLFTLGLSILSAMTHFALRYTGSSRFAGYRALQLYAGALVLSPICWTDSFLHVRTEPVAETSSWLYADPFQPVVGGLVFTYSAVWLGVNAYVQWLLWPHRRIQEGNDPTRPRINMVWVGIFISAVGGLVDLLFACTGYAGVTPNTAFQGAAMTAMAVGLARESSQLGKARA